MIEKKPFLIISSLESFFFIYADSEKPTWQFTLLITFYFELNWKKLKSKEKEN